MWLSVQYQGSALRGQVANGRPWDLDRNRGGLRLLMPQEGTGAHGRGGLRPKGNADELFRFRDQIRNADPEVVLVMSADHVYRLDFRDVLARTGSARPSAPWWSPTEVSARTPPTTPSSRSSASVG